MSERGSALVMDKMLGSSSEAARLAEEQARYETAQRAAARVVAAAATDAEDCRALLAALGLDREVLLAARRPRSAASNDSSTRSGPAGVASSVLTDARSTDATSTGAGPTSARRSRRGHAA